MAASKNLELAGLEFQNYSPGHPRFLARSGPNFFRKLSDHGLSLGDRHVLLKSVLGGNGFGGPVRDNFAIVDTAGEFMQVETKPAELLQQR